MTVKDENASENASSGSFWQHLVEAGITEAILHYVTQSPLAESMAQQQDMVRGVSGFTCAQSSSRPQLCLSVKGICDDAVDRNPTIRSTERKMLLK